MVDLSQKYIRSGGIYGGAPPPIKRAGRYFLPHTHNSTGSPVTTTAGRYYVVPFYIDRAKTFIGAFCHNSGTGNNGHNVKIAMYNEAVSGGPGTLAKNFGEVTLDGTAALRPFASSWAAAPGMYFMELVTDNAVALYAMSSGVSYSSAANYSAGYMGAIGQTIFGVGALSYAGALPSGEYVAGTYANFPEATSLDPTTTILASSTSFPLFGLYT